MKSDFELIKAMSKALFGDDAIVLRQENGWQAGGFDYYALPDGRSNKIVCISALTMPWVALWVAGELGMTVTIEKNFVVAEVKARGISERLEADGGKMQEAMCRAIVILAAKIGREK